MKLFYRGACIVIYLAVIACNKDKGTEVIKKLTAADAGGTAAVVTGQTISLTLSNPGDGGYQFNNPKYNTTVLTLVQHTHQNVANNNVGDFGNDTWQFTAKASGTTQLEVTASRGGQASETISLFANQIKVK